MDKYSSQYELICQLRKLGAVAVEVGDIKVSFLPTQPESPVLADLVGQGSTQFDEEAAKAEWEQAQYFASGSY